MEMWLMYLEIAKNSVSQQTLLFELVDENFELGIPSFTKAADKRFA